MCTILKIDIDYGRYFLCCLSGTRQHNVPTIENDIVNQERYLIWFKLSRTTLSNKRSIEVF